MIVLRQSVVVDVVNLCVLFVQKLMARVNLAVGTRMNMLMNNTENPQPRLIDYPIVEFSCGDTNIKQRKRAYQIGEWLLVSTYGNVYKIYRADTGKPIVGAIFDKAEIAVQIAQLLSDRYEAYFPIWQDYPNADIFTLAQWSVEHGIDINKIIKEAKTESDFRRSI